MTPAGASFFQAIADLFHHWIGWGWASALLVWAAGTLVILTLVYRWFLERFGSRLPTAAVFVLWTLAVVGVAARYLGFGPPAG